MPAPLAKLYSAQRSRQSIRIIAYAAAAAVCLYALHVSGFLFTVAVCLFAAPAVVNYARSVKERHGDENPDWLLKTNKQGSDRREFELLPYQNPFDTVSVDLALEDRITAAAEASMQFGRRVSIVHIHAPGVGRALIDEAAAVARIKLRKTDHVEVITDDELIVCVNMVRDMQNADLVLNRVRDALLGQGLDCAGWSFGRAICPVHGYNGTDLIESARRDSGVFAQPIPTGSGQRLHARDGLAAVVCEA